MRLIPNLPTETFYNTDTPNIKLYTGALPDAIKNVLDRDAINKLKITQVKDIITPLKTINCFRHFESNYNIYKKRIEANPRYKEFLTTTDEDIKKSIAQELMKEFMDTVKIDYHTPISSDGKQQADTYGQAYGELFSQNPELMPDKISISPYSRTKYTAHSLLKNLQGLDMDIDFLLHDDDLTDMRIGEYQKKPVVLTLQDAIRERDFGNNYGPRFIRELLQNNEFKAPLDDISKQKSYYYTSTNGGESQTMVNQRAKTFFYGLTDDNTYKNHMVFTHHLLILAELNNIFAGSFNTFYNLDTHRKPKNGGMTTLVEIPGKDYSQDNKLRVAAYNLTPQQ